MTAKPDFILPLSEASAGVSLLGGKGASLGRLVAAGLPVPPGFHITTAAYRRFVAEHGLQEQILAAVSAATPFQPAALEEVSSRIVQLFAQSALPEQIATEIRRAYADLGAYAELGAYADLGARDVSVAVRSSATAEDLPEASFAGQQETYLNIHGAEALLEAVKKCWASLWTARAIAYRARQGIAPDSVALAVVVQELVPADAAGIMFTANPTSGKREEIIINAAWGLGEAIVSGAVTPDALTVEKATGKTIRRQIAEKQTMTVAAETGTHEVPVPASGKRKAVLTDAQAAELAKLGADIEKLYEMPMDIEWTLASGKFAIVQARPITALPEPLEWKSPYPKPLLAHGDSIDLAPDAVSPLFATLGIPIANKVYLKMYDRVMGLRGEDVPIFVILNGYIYLCFVKRSRFWKYMSRHTTTVGRLYAYGNGDVGMIIWE
jgi:rifampicin phosphotransferase